MDNHCHSTKRNQFEMKNKNKEEGKKKETRQERRKGDQTKAPFLSLSLSVSHHSLCSLCPAFSHSAIHKNIPINTEQSCWFTQDINNIIAEFDRS
jgi:predicted nucleic acid-binding protein